MSRQARKLQPRWRTPAPAGPVIAVSNRRHAKAMAREFARQTGRPEPGVVAATNTYRWRRQLVPFWLLLALVFTGETAHLMREWKLALELAKSFDPIDYKAMTIFTEARDERLKELRKAK